MSNELLAEKSNDLELVTLTWVAALAGVSVSTIYRRIETYGGLHVHKVNGRTSVVRRAEAIAFVNSLPD